MASIVWREGLQGSWWQLARVNGYGLKQHDLRGAESSRDPRTILSRPIGSIRRLSRVDSRWEEGGLAFSLGQVLKCGGVEL